MIVAQHRVDGAPVLYGPAGEFWRYKGVEVILSGPYETGKTYGWVSKLHALCVKYPNVQAVIFRQTYKSLLTTVVKTYENKVLPIHPDHPGSPIKKLGKSKPELYEYPNGSQIYVVGLDNPDKLLSGEFDFAGGAQLEEISLNAWEQILSRLTGRSGNTPYTQLMGDCNPGPPKHWILERKTLKVFTQLHKYNPTLYDQETGEITTQGKKTMQILNSLTGIRYQRGVLGKWVGAEGAVYENFNYGIHVIDKMPDGWETWRKFRSIDFGFTNPFVCQWWAVDHDGRMYLYREIYMSRRNVNDHAEQIKLYSENEHIDYSVSDHDAGERDILHRAGIPTVAAKKDIAVGIETTQLRFRDAGDGQPRIFFVRDALVEEDEYLKENHLPLCTIDEIPEYVYPKGPDGKTNKEHPVKDKDHGQDAMRYAVMSQEQGKLFLFDMDD